VHRPEERAQVRYAVTYWTMKACLSLEYPLSRLASLCDDSGFIKLDLGHRKDNCRIHYLGHRAHVKLNDVHVIAVMPHIRHAHV
jgi:hypothetical protein